MFNKYYNNNNLNNNIFNRARSQRNLPHYKCFTAPLFAFRNFKTQNEAQNLFSKLNTYINLLNIIKQNQIEFFNDFHEKNISNVYIFIIQNLKNLKHSLELNFSYQNDLKQNLIEEKNLLYNSIIIKNKKNSTIEYEKNELEKLNFKISNEIIKINNEINIIKNEIIQQKNIEIFHDFNLFSVNLCDYKQSQKIENELEKIKNNLKLIENEKKFELQRNKNEIYNTNFNLKKYNEIISNNNFGKKYIETEDIIEEDKFEVSYFSSIYNNNNNNHNTEYLDSNESKKKKLIVNHNKNFNLNINLNINLNNNNNNIDNNNNNNNNNDNNSDKSNYSNDSNEFELNFETAYSSIQKLINGIKAKENKVGNKSFDCECNLSKNNINNININNENNIFVENLNKSL